MLVKYFRVGEHSGLSDMGNNCTWNTVELEDGSTGFLMHARRFKPTFVSALVAFFGFGSYRKAELKEITKEYLGTKEKTYYACKSNFIHITIIDECSPLYGYVFRVVLENSHYFEERDDMHYMNTVGEINLPGFGKFNCREFYFFDFEYNDWHWNGGYKD